MCLSVIAPPGLGHDDDDDNDDADVCMYVGMDGSWSIK